MDNGHFVLNSRYCWWFMPFADGTTEASVIKNYHNNVQRFTRQNAREKTEDKVVEVLSEIFKEVETPKEEVTLFRLVNGGKPNKFSKEVLIIPDDQAGILQQI